MYQYNLYSRVVNISAATSDTDVSDTEDTLTPPLAAAVLLSESANSGRLHWQPGTSILRANSGSRFSRRGFRKPCNTCGIPLVLDRLEQPCCGLPTPAWSCGCSRPTRRAPVPDGAAGVQEAVGASVRCWGSAPGGRGTVYFSCFFSYRSFPRRFACCWMRETTSLCATCQWKLIGCGSNTPTSTVPYWLPPRNMSLPSQLFSRRLHVTPQQGSEGCYPRGPGGHSLLLLLKLLIIWRPIPTSPVSLSVYATGKVSPHILRVNS